MLESSSGRLENFTMMQILTKVRKLISSFLSSNAVESSVFDLHNKNYTSVKLL